MYGWAAHPQGRSQEFTSGGQVRGSAGRKSPAGSRGQGPCGGLGAKPRKLETNVGVQYREKLEKQTNHQYKAIFM